MRITKGKGLRAGAILGLLVLVTGMTAMADTSQVIYIGEGMKEENTMEQETGTAKAQPEETGTAGAKKNQPGQVVTAGAGKGANSLGLDLAGLSLDPETSQLVAVVGSGMDSSSVQVAYFKKEEAGDWKEEFCVPGYCGYQGMTGEKKEGDRRTPVGNYGFAAAFGILPDPGSRIPYRQVREGDFWVDDSNSPYYNQMVNSNEVAWAWNSAEELMRIVPAYHYVLALDYNTQERVPGKGSAIFLHGIDPKKTWTEGCIAIPQERVKQLLQELGPEARIVILPDSQ